MKEQASVPRITQTMIEAQIVETLYFTAKDGFKEAYLVRESKATDTKLLNELGQVTICIIMMKNGMKLVGINTGSIDPASHNVEMGKRLAYENAFEQAWALLGYELRSKILAGDLLA